MEWISVKDRIPKPGDKVLCCFERSKGINRGVEHNIDSYYWSDFWENSRITHWTPLPKPPFEQGE